MPETIAVENLKLLYKVKIAEKAHRWNDMKDASTKLAFTKQQLNEKERALMDRSFKNVLTPYRDAFHIASADAKYHQDPAIAKLAADYSYELKEEISILCTEVLQIIRLLRRTVANDQQVQAFYSNMEGNYYRYLSEIDPVNVEGAEKAYRHAFDLINQFQKGHTTRMSIILNYAIFKFTIKKECQAALDMLNDELADIQPNKQDFEAYQLYLLMRDNYKHWTEDILAKDPPMMTVQ